MAEEQTGPKQKRRDALQGILRPLAIEEGSKTQISDHVFRTNYTGKNLQGVLDPLDIPDATKAAIWNLKWGRMPAAPAPIPTPTPSLAPTGAAQRIQAAPAATIAPTPEEKPKEMELPPAALLSAHQKIGETIPPVPELVEPSVPGVEPDLAVSGVKPEPDLAELVTPKLPSGYSPPLVMGGRPGRFNFNRPPVIDEGTPGARYAFETEDGGTWMYQLESKFQGGRWEDAVHAEDDYQDYVGMDNKSRQSMLDEKWQGDLNISRTIDAFAKAGKPFPELQAALKEGQLNTHRQISTPEQRPEKDPLAIDWIDAAHPMVLMSKLPGLARTTWKDFKDWGKREVDMAKIDLGPEELGRVEQSIGGIAMGLGNIFAGVIQTPAIAQSALEKLAIKFDFKLPGEFGVRTPKEIEKAYESPTDKDMYQLGESLRAGLVKAFPQNPVFAESFAVSVLPQGAGSLAGFYLLGGLGSKAGLSSWAVPLLAGSATESAALYREAKQHGANDEAALAAWVGGLLTGSTEAVPIGMAFSRFNKATGGNATRMLRSGFAGSIEEGVQELVQQLGGNITAKMTFDEQRDYWEGVSEGAGAGGILGFAANMMMSAMGIRRMREMGFETQDEMDKFYRNMERFDKSYAEASQKVRTEAMVKAAGVQKPLPFETVQQPPAIPPAASAPPAAVPPTPAEEEGVAPPKEPPAGAMRVKAEEEKQIEREREKEAPPTEAVAPEVASVVTPAEEAVAPPVPLDQARQASAEYVDGLRSPEQKRWAGEYTNWRYGAGTEIPFPPKTIVASKVIRKQVDEIAERFGVPARGTPPVEEVLPTAIAPTPDKPAAKKPAAKKPVTPQVEAIPGMTPLGVTPLPIATGETVIYKGKEVDVMDTFVNDEGVEMVSLATGAVGATSVPVSEVSRQEPTAAIAPTPEETGLKGLTGREAELLGAIRELEKDMKEEAELEAGEGLNPHQLIAQTIQDELAAGETIGNPRLTEIANEAFGGEKGEGKYTPSDSQDAAEAGVNMMIEAADPAIVDFNDPEGTYDRLLEITARLPRQTDRTTEKEEFQQFSTPPGQAFTATYAAGITPGMTALEPSAGTGNIAVQMRLAGANVSVNELTDRRAQILRNQGFKTEQVDAELLNSTLDPKIQPDVIVMNPPFSATGGKTKGHATLHGAKHVEQALIRLNEGGRLVAIVGQGMAHDRPNFQKWWKKIEGKYTVRANIGISGKHYAKYGTTFDNNIIVIDKTGPTPGDTRIDQLNNVILGKDLSPKEALKLLGPLAKEDISGRLSKPAEQAGIPATPGGVRPSPAPEGVPSPGATGRGPGGRERIPPTPTGVGGAVTGTVGPVAGRVEPESEGPVAGVGEADVTGRQPDTGEGRRPGDVGGEPGGPGAGRVGPVSPGLTRIEEARQSAVEEEEVFSAYTVQKALFEGSQPHPADIVESSTMASVLAPDVTYTPNLPPEVVQEGRLSDVQMEAVTYAGQRHSQTMADGKTPGYWIGDGTGVGKGREVGGIIYDNFNRGRKRAVWVSVSHQLRADAERDLKGVGVPMDLIHHGITKTKDQIADEDGVLFTTYSLLAHGWKGTKARYKQLESWLGKDFDGVIVFDEAHAMKNAIGTGHGGTVSDKAGTDRGAMGLSVQEAFPKAKIVYVSATGATVPRNMGYMQRLGLWGAGGPFSTFIDFLGAMTRGGIGAMEMLSRDLKSIGAYISRSISYKGVDYETITHDLNDLQVGQYNQMADLWDDLLTAFEEAQENAGQKKGGTAFSQFYARQQQFFLQLMMSYQLPDLLAAADKDLAAGRSTVISLYNTNQAQTDRAITKATAAGEDAENLDLTPREMIVQLIESQFPLEQYEDKYDPATGRTSPVPVLQDGEPLINRENLAKQQDLIDKVSDIQLPVNPMDEIVDHFGVSNIAEISGRPRRIVNGKPERRSIKGVSFKDLNLHETARFQNQDVRIAIITGAASTGISLHSDKTAKNQQRRVFYAMQLSWSADQQMQAFGRVHRSFQAEAPIIKLLRTNLRGQERLINTVAKRLASLGALTKGGRETLGGSLFEVEDITDQYGEAALSETYRAIQRDAIDGVKTGMQLLQRMGIASADGKLRRAHLTDVNRFLNRIMALHVDVQNSVFEHFYAEYQRISQIAKQDGTFDVGVTPVTDERNRRPTSLVLKSKPEVVYTHPESKAETVLIELEGDFPVPKMAFGDSPMTTRPMGYYVNKRSEKIYVAHRTEKSKWSHQALQAGKEGYQAQVLLSSPTGNAHEVEAYQLEEDQNFTQLEEAAAETQWNKEYSEIPDSVKKPVHLLTAPIFPIYDKVTGDEQIRRLGVVRATLDDGSSHIGIAVQPGEIGGLKQRLGIGTPLGNATAQEIYDLVLNNKSMIELDNGWRLLMTKVKREDRMELDAGRNYNKEELETFGLKSEKIDYKRRFFIPLDSVEGPNALGRLLERHKAVKDRTGMQPDVRPEAATYGDPDVMPGETAEPGTLPPSPEGGGAPGIASVLPASPEQVLFPFKTESATGFGLDQLPADFQQNVEDPILGFNAERDMEMEMLDQLTDKGKPMGAPEIIKSFENVLTAADRTVPFRLHRFRKKARGIFKVLAEVIRLRVANNLPTAAHEMGHALDKAVFGYLRGSKSHWETRPPVVRAELVKMGKDLYKSKHPEGGYKREGFAEFIRLELTTDIEAARKAPQTHRWFVKEFLKDNPKIADAFNEAKSAVTKWRLQGAVQRGKAMKAAITPTVKQRLLSILDLFSYQKWVEAGSAYEHLTSIATTLKGSGIAIEENPELTFHALRHTHTARAAYMVEDHMINIAGVPVGPSLEDAGALVKDQREEFTLYLWGRRAIERWKENKNPGISKNDAEFLVEHFETPEFQRAAQKVYEWNRGVLNYAVQGGLITQQALDKIIEGSQDYIPLARVLDDIDSGYVRRLRGGWSTGSITNRMRGSGRRIRDPFEVMIENATNIILKTHQRIIIDQILKLRHIEGMGHMIEEVDRGVVPVTISTAQVLGVLKQKGIEIGETAEDVLLKAEGFQKLESPEETLDSILTFFIPAQHPKGMDPIIPLVENGVVRWFQIDPELYASLSGLDVYRLPKGWDIVLGKPARLFRLGTTGLRASFAWVRNPARDLQTFFMQTASNANPAELAAAWTFQMQDIIRHGKQSEHYDLMRRLGAEVSQPLGIDIRFTRRAAKRLFRGRVMKVVTNPIDHLREIMQIPESATRTAELKLRAKEMGWKPGQPMSFAQSLQLLLDTKRVTVDFSAGGSVGQAVNQAVPFFNAQIQGTRLTLRTFKSKPKRTVIRGVMGLTSLTLALWWLNKDEEWYTDMPYWERFTYWNIDDGKHIWQIPRGFEWGTIFTAVPEAIWDAMYRQDPEAIIEVFGQWSEQVNPAALPVIPDVVLEQFANERFFTNSPIVPIGELNDPPGDQRGPYTSKLAGMLGDMFPNQASPRRIDHAIRGFFGGLGPDILDTLGLGVPSRRISLKELEGVPILSSLVRPGGREGRRSLAVDTFYEDLSREQRRFNGQKNKGESETTNQRHYRQVLEDAHDTIIMINHVQRALDPVKQKQKVSDFNVAKRHIARDAVDKKGIAPNPDEMLAYAAGRVNMELGDKYEAATDAAIEAQLVDEDPAAFWSKLKVIQEQPGPSMDIKNIAQRLDSLRMKISLLEAARAMPGVKNLEEINTQLNQLYWERNQSRFKATRSGARMQMEPIPVTPENIPVTPEVPTELPPTP